MKKFNDFVNEAAAKDHVARPNTDDEEKGAKRRSKKEREFIAKHEVEVKDYPVKKGLEESVSVGPFKLKDGTTVKIDKETAAILNKAMADLSPSNMKRMHDEMSKNKQSFEDIVNFARDV